MTTTLHLVPTEIWTGSDPARPYAPPSIEDEGFVHCTNGEDEVLRTGDRYYREDPRDWLVLTIDLERVTAPWTVADPDERFPHVHGVIDRAAIVDVRRVLRSSDGSFDAIVALGTHGGAASTTG